MSYSKRTKVELVRDTRRRMPGYGCEEVSQERQAWDFPGGPVDKTLCSHCRVAGVRSLDKKLRSRILCGVARIIKEN